MARENTVQNMSAAEAWVPIYAHVQYWGGKTLRAAMREAITEPLKEADFPLSHGYPQSLHHLCTLPCHLSRPTLVERFGSRRRGESLESCRLHPGRGLSRDFEIRPECDLRKKSTGISGHFRWSRS
jgi:hypothetical protein